MRPTYATRYTLLAFIIALAFVFTHATLDLLEGNLPFDLNSFWRSIGWGDLLVMTTPLTFSALAYLAGRQRDRVQTQARYLDAINRMNRSLTHSLDLDQTLPAALQQIVTALHMDHAALYLFERESLSIRATTPDLPDLLAELVQQIQVENWLPLLLPRTAEQPFVMVDLQDEARLPMTLQHSSYRELVSVVIQTGEQSIGLLLIIGRQRQRFSSEQSSFLLTSAQQIGSALARMRPYAEIRRRARDLEAVAQVNRTLLAGMELDDMLSMIVNAAQVRFGLPYVAVLWVDEAAQEFFVRAQAGPLAASAPPGKRLKLTEGLSAQVYRTGLPYLARDVRSEAEFVPASEAPVLSSLLVPMMASGKVIGVMAFDSLGLDAFSEADVAALTTLSDQVTIAAQNARLYAEAQRERRRVSAILNSTRDLVMLIDPHDCVQLLNPAAERVLNLPAADGLGQPIGQVLREAALLEAYHWLSQRGADDDSPPREVTLNTTTYAFTVTSAKDEAGAFFGRVLVMQDITYLKQLDQFRTQMIQMASHDLRNPLGVAMGYVELLYDELQPMTPLRKQVMKGIENALARMQNLISDLLDMERIESGADRRREPIALDQLVGSVAEELREQAEKKYQTLDVFLAPPPPLVTGDGVRLRQALSNIIGNAIKYTPDGGHVWVRLSRNAHTAILEVQDNGYGIPKASQAKLFQRFYRAKAPGTESIDGTGLGLSLVKAVIEQHGGQISVESDLGQGSTFRVTLPLMTDPPPG